MMRLDLVRSEELPTSDFWMARFGALRGVRSCILVQRKVCFNKQCLS